MTIPPVGGPGAAPASGGSAGGSPDDAFTALLERHLGQERKAAHPPATSRSSAPSREGGAASGRSGSGSTDRSVTRPDPAAHGAPRGHRAGGAPADSAAKASRGTSDADAIDRAGAAAAGTEAVPAAAQGLDAASATQVGAASAGTAPGLQVGIAPSGADGNSGPAAAAGLVTTATGSASATARADVVEPGAASGAVAAAGTDAADPRLAGAEHGTVGVGTGVGRVLAGASRKGAAASSGTDVAGAGAVAGASGHADGTTSPGTVASPSLTVPAGEPSGARRVDLLLKGRQQVRLGTSDAGQGAGDATTGSTTVAGGGAATLVGIQQAGAGTGAPAGPPGGGVPGNPVTDQVFAQVARLVNRGDGTHRLMLRLHPADLGEVKIVLTVRGDTVDVTLAADARAREALHQGSPQLRALLELTGATAGHVVIRDLSTGAVTLASSSSGQQPGGNGDNGDQATPQGNPDGLASQGDGFGSRPDGQNGRRTPEPTSLPSGGEATAHVPAGTGASPGASGSPPRRGEPTPARLDLNL